MLTAPTFRKVLPSLGKFGVWLGITALSKQLAGSTELATTLASIGVSSGNLNGISEVINGLASSKLSDYYKEVRENTSYGMGHDLQRAMQDGMSHALAELQTAFIEQEAVPDKEVGQLKLYFRSLSHHLNEEEFTDDSVNAYVLNTRAFFDNLLKHVHQLPADSELVETRDIPDGVLIPELTNEVAQQLIEFLLNNLESYAQRYINEELKGNDKAKTAYFIHLLEYGARLNQDNNAILQQVSHALNDVGQHQQHTDLLRQIIHAQQLIYDSLRKLQIDFRAYVSDFADFKKRLDAQHEPPLSLPNLTNLPASFSYQYGLRYTSFISREEEINRLWNFLNDQPDRKMLWWLITGPGGMGKSRLALEFCLEARCVNRYVGFLQSQHIGGFDWSHWRPAHPTLIVVDYVAAYAEPARQMIASLSINAQNNLLAHPVRVLLLERETRDDWWNRFLADPNVVECSYYSGNPRQVLTLLPFDHTSRWQIITEIHRKKSEPVRVNQEQILQKLAELDPEGRPLFAFLTGMALADGDDIRRWDVHDLLDNLLQREEDKVWSHHPKWQDERCREGHKNLLVLTTLCRGLSTNRLVSLFEQNIEWLPERRPDASLYEHLSDIRERVSTQGDKEKVYEGLQPDLIGEYFVLKRISQLLKDDFVGTETVKALLQTSWNVAPESTWWTVWLTINDFQRFPDSNAFSYLVDSRPSTDVTEINHEHWSVLQFNLTTDYSHQQQWPQAEVHYANLQALTLAYSYNEQIALHQAMGAANLTMEYSPYQKKWSQAEACYADLQVLAKAFPHNEQIVLAQAMGVYNLTNWYSRHQHWPQAEVRYDNLRALTQAYPHNEEIVLRQAKGAFALTTDYSRHRHWSQSQVHYADMKALSKAYRHNEEIVFGQARAAYDFIRWSSTHQQWPQAEVLYADLQALSKAYPDNVEIVLGQAMGAAAQLYVASEYVKTSRKEYFVMLFYQLRTLLERHKLSLAWRESVSFLKKVWTANQWLID